MSQKSTDTIRWKAVTVDYDTLTGYDDDEKCIVCLTPRQAIALIGHMRAMYWKTRWENLPLAFDLHSWVSDIESELLDVCCGSSDQLRQLVQCVCELQTVINNQINVDAGNNAPVIPPDDPAQNLPPLDPTDYPQQQRLDAAICDASNLVVRMIFATLTEGQRVKCETGNDPDWSAIATQVAAGSIAAASLPFNPLISTALVATAIAASAFALADEAFDFNLIPDEEGCPPPPLPEDVIQAYGCQLWQWVSANGKEYDNVKVAFDCPNPQAITRWNSIYPTGLFGGLLDTATRGTLAEFIAKPQFYQQYIALMADMAGFEYTDVNLCPDCAECNPSTERRITEWNDPAIVSINPPPETIIDDSTYSWPAGTLVEVVLNTEYCLQRVNLRLIRGATVSSPTAVTVTVGTNQYSDSTGSFGPGTLDIGTNGDLCKRFTMQSDASSNNMTLGLNDRFDNGITIRTPLPYYDCT